MLKGTIAVCSAGFLGLITSDKPKEITYPDGNKGIAWTGIMLSGKNIGKPWSSRNPIIVAHVEELLAKAEQKGLDNDQPTNA